jgi:hypothetical protein
LRKQAKLGPPSGLQAGRRRRARERLPQAYADA